MYVALKYILFLLGLFAAFVAIKNQNIASGIVSAGAFIAFALLEIQDLKIINDDKE